MNLGPTEIIIMLVMLALFVVPIWGIVDAAVRPQAVWTATGQSKALWIILQLVLGILGAIIYFAAIRPKLVAVTTRPYP